MLHSYFVTGAFFLQITSKAATDALSSPTFHQVAQISRSGHPTRHKMVLVQSVARTIENQFHVILYFPIRQK